MVAEATVVVELSHRGILNVWATFYNINTDTNDHPNPQTTYGYLINNVTQGHFNIVQLPGNALAPYGFVNYRRACDPLFIIFLAYFYSLWFSSWESSDGITCWFNVWRNVPIHDRWVGDRVASTDCTISIWLSDSLYCRFIMSMFKNM